MLRERLAREDAQKTGVTVRFQTNLVRFLRNAEDLVEQSYRMIANKRMLKALDD